MGIVATCDRCHREWPLTRDELMDMPPWSDGIYCPQCQEEATAFEEFVREQIDALRKKLLDEFEASAREHS